MSEVTFIIPIGPAHQELAARAIASAQAQTVPCEVLYQLDTQQRGPGVLRNQMLMRTMTEFVVFLDADDWVEPTFVEETLAEYRRIGGNAYIFTDWVNARNEVIEAPCKNGPDHQPVSTPDLKPYCGGTWHTITALIPTAWARAVNGFDEQLPAVEDTDFFLKLCTTFRCGHRLARPLFHYSPAGGRGLNFHNSPDLDRVMGELTLRYGGKMGCCGGDATVVLPIGEKQPGDVLAMAMWHGNRSEFGRITRRHYPRISYPRTAWVDPKDVAQSPQLWQPVDQPTVDANTGSNSIQEIAAMGMATVVKKPYAPPAFEGPVPPVEAKPDVARVKRLGKRAVEKLDQPIFVFPEKDYPSYSDIKRLVALSGFDSTTFKQIDVFSRRPLIVVSPEPIPNLNGVMARVICWQLEYAGEYTGNYAGFKGEVWASDKGWADANGAKYVLLGSHPDLVGDSLRSRSMDWDYDVTMLSYMTPRRQAIKDQLADLRWPVDYPGHAGQARADVLWGSRLMLQVHQHDDAPYIAPQRIALAAAFSMPVISEAVADPGDLLRLMPWTAYPVLSRFVRLSAQDPETWQRAKPFGEALHKFLCLERSFRICVEEALKA
jgi:hypothetical protein